MTGLDCGALILNVMLDHLKCFEILIKDFIHIFKISEMCLYIYWEPAKCKWSWKSLGVMMRHISWHIYFYSFLKTFYLLFIVV